MDQEASRVASCTKGCRGDLVLATGFNDHPDYWVRPRVGGPSGWWCSNVAPMPPKERPGRLTYKCGACDATYRLVEAVSVAPPPARRSNER